MSLYNGEADQIKLRLQGTVIMYDDRPVYVASVEGRRIGLSFLPQMRDVFHVPFDDDKINIRDFKLGYVNYNNQTYYAQRMMARQQRQGLCAANVTWANRDRVIWNDIIRRGEFADMLRGVYPAFQEVIDKLETQPGLKQMAFNRRFSLAKDPDLGFYELHYRGRRVAWGDPTSFNLPSDHTYLSEVIAAEGISIR